MKILISYYVPSGGMETLNRLRAEALAKHGVVCHLHYQMYGSGLQNNTSSIPTFITNNELELQHLLLTGQYDAVIVSHDYMMLERVRRLGYQRIVLFEVQGLGQRSDAVQILLAAAPFIRKYSNAVFYPRTSHLVELFRGMFPDVGQFCFPNLLDTERFRYRPLPVHPYPIMGWVGRIETNKNWRGFLQIGYHLREMVPNLQLWMFHDSQLNQPEEFDAFQHMVAAQGIGSHLHLLSNVPHRDMADYFSMIGDSGGFLASTSILEGFGYAVAEAMLCRCPVLSTDSDGVRSFIIHDVTGKFYPSGNLEAALTHAMDLITNAQLRKNIRDNGERHIMEHYSPDKYCPQFLEMVHSLGIY
ncbi:glycosyltransferase family 4 protein [Paenibacillus filicis]|uniref:Glycosyltransferase family 4 protein n=1 Tax=Paenibacillus gyeongsangnamensis TaxID=3388067 RepID=A0ABT4Q9S8_9BACL|nr:glycosyltransferase family 4 protein [Paenibacillus filicis]MCZ8513586.1 glycosyltransferase family 4 protein [Paenibacillus filicis]